MSIIRNVKSCFGQGLKQGLKRAVKEVLADGQRKKYGRILEKKTVTYDAWIRQIEEERAKVREEGHQLHALKIKEIPYQACMDYCLGKTLPRETADVLVFMDAEGMAGENAREEIGEYFSAHKGIKMLYGDEDVMSPEGIRYTPWFKPDWSPDTFLSFFYFGSIFAVRTWLLQELTDEEMRWAFEEEGKKGEEERKGIYRLCYLLAVKCGGFAKRGVDVEGRKKEADRDEDGRNQEEGRNQENEDKESRDGEWNFPIGHLDEVLFHGKSNREMMLERVQGELLEDLLRQRMEENLEQLSGAMGKQISIIIPSKDHPELLKRCILSLAAEAGQEYGKKYEIIIVDNGSQEETKRELEGWLEEQEVPAKYIYRPMPFHFSRMCNMGAEAAEGEVLLFFNDDVEIPGKSGELGKESGNLLQYLSLMAVRPYVGAVGVKLYYPDSIRIQHAGIVNLGPGPVHKLQFKEDNISYYYGWNRKRRNVIAVTGACLAVEKKKYMEAGGFPEELPVAFNDVDFCFSLFEKGYYNVVLQDIPLYHHESLSRGNDDDREKLERLLQEKDKLYERHSALAGKDPFYHKYLASDILSTGFELKAEYELEPELIYRKPHAAGNLLAGAREDACVMISIEYAGPVPSFGGKESRATDYLIQGYSFVTGSDNAIFEKRIILAREQDAFWGANAAEGGAAVPGKGKEGYQAGLLSVAPEPMIRRDVEENLPDQTGVGLTGFCAIIDGSGGQGGCYQIGVLVKDKSSGQKLYSWTNRYLKMGKCGTGKASDELENSTCPDSTSENLRTRKRP